MQNNRKKFLLFLFIASIFLGITGYYQFRNNPISFSADSITSHIWKIFPIGNSDSKPNLPNEPGRITNESCGLSFVIPSEWNIKEKTSGNRYCYYEVNAPEFRVASLEVGVPGFVLGNKNPSEPVTWDDIMQVMNSSPGNYQITHVIIAGVPGIRVLVPQDGGWQPNVMYFFRKGDSVFYARYSIFINDYERYNQLNNKQINTAEYYKDIDPVLQSIRFSKEDSFYNSPMTVGTR